MLNNSCYEIKIHFLEICYDENTRLHKKYKKGKKCKICFHNSCNCMFTLTQTRGIKKTGCNCQLSSQISASSIIMMMVEIHLR